MYLDVEGVVEIKPAHSKDHPDGVAENLSAYGGGRLVTGIEIMSTSINTKAAKQQTKDPVQLSWTAIGTLTNAYDNLTMRSSTDDSDTDITSDIQNTYRILH